MPSTKRELLIATAMDLFCARGVHGVGVDSVVAASGVAKATLYKHFRSKDELVLAALRRMDEEGRRNLARAVEAASDDARERFLAVPDLVARGAGNGCFFVLAAQEFPDPEHPIHAAAREHKRLFGAWLADLAEAAGAAGAAGAVGREGAGIAALLVLDGMYAAAALGDADLERARLAARGVFERMLG